MKRFVIFLVLSLMLTGIGAGFNVLRAQDEVADSLSIDDMTPLVLYQEEEDEPAESSTGIYVAIAAGIALVAFVGFRMTKKKK